MPQPSSNMSIPRFSTSSSSFYTTTPNPMMSKEDKFKVDTQGYSLSPHINNLGPSGQSGFSIQSYHYSGPL